MGTFLPRLDTRRKISRQFDRDSKLQDETRLMAGSVLKIKDYGTSKKGKTISRRVPRDFLHFLIILSDLSGHRPAQNGALGEAVHVGAVFP